MFIDPCLSHKTTMRYYWQFALVTRLWLRPVRYSTAGCFACQAFLEITRLTNPERYAVPRPRRGGGGPIVAPRRTDRSSTRKERTDLSVRISITKSEIQFRRRHLSWAKASRSQECPRPRSGSVLSSQKWEYPSQVPLFGERAKPRSLSSSISPHVDWFMMIQSFYNPHIYSSSALALLWMSILEAILVCSVLWEVIAINEISANDHTWSHMIMSVFAEDLAYSTDPFSMGPMSMCIDV